MTIEASLVQHLQGDADVATLVATRVFPLVIPQGNDKARQPCIVYQRIGSSRGQTFCATDRLVAGTFQLDCYGRKHTEALVLAAHVRDALVDFGGDMHGTHVNKISLETELELLDPNPGLFRVSQTYVIWYLEE